MLSVTAPTTRGMIDPDAPASYVSSRRGSRYYSRFMKSIVATAMLLMSCTSAARKVHPVVSRADSQWEEAKTPICNAAPNGTVIQAALSTSRPDVQFAGRVVTRRSDGSLQPLTGARFFEYQYNFFEPGVVKDWESGKSYLAPISLSTGPDGTFRSDQIWPHAVLSRSCENGRIVETRISIANVYIVRFPSCEELPVVYDLTWTPHDLIVNCSGLVLPATPSQLHAP